MQVWNMLHTARWNYRMQKTAKNLPSVHHRTTLSGCIFTTKARINNRKKNLLKSNISSTCPYNMVNFGPLAAEIGLLVWGTPANFNGFRVLAALQHSTPPSSGGCQPKFAALNRGRHLYSAGWPSRWALAHILVYLWNVYQNTVVVWPTMMCCIDWLQGSRVMFAIIGWWMSDTQRLKVKVMSWKYCMFFMQYCMIMLFSISSRSEYGAAYSLLLRKNPK